MYRLPWRDVLPVWELVWHGVIGCHRTSEVGITGFNFSRDDHVDMAVKAYFIWKGGKFKLYLTCLQSTALLSLWNILYPLSSLWNNFDTRQCSWGGRGAVTPSCRTVLLMKNHPHSIPFTSTQLSASLYCFRKSGAIFSGIPSVLCIFQRDRSKAAFKSMKPIDMTVFLERILLLTFPFLFYSPY